MEFSYLIEEFRDLGFSVTKVNEHSVIIQNNGVEKTYREFEETITLLTDENGFGFIAQKEVQEVSKQIDHNNQPIENYDVYMGVYKGHDKFVLEESKFPLALVH